MPVSAVLCVLLSSLFCFFLLTTTHSVRSHFITRALKKLNLSENEVFNEHLPGVHALAAALKVNTTITELHLASNRLDPECGGILAPAIAPLMVKLNMSDNNFCGSAAGKAMGDMIVANPMLEELDLSECNMQSESSQAFAVGLGANRALTSLNMSDNSLGGNYNNEWNDEWIPDMSGIKALAAAISECK